MPTHLDNWKKYALCLSYHSLGLLGIGNILKIYKINFISHRLRTIFYRWAFSMRFSRFLERRCFFGGFRGGACPWDRRFLWWKAPRCRWIRCIQRHEHILYPSGNLTGRLPEHKQGFVPSAQQRNDGAANKAYDRYNSVLHFSPSFKKRVQKGNG